VSTIEDKQTTLSRILAAWQKEPHMRLGQFLWSAMWDCEGKPDTYYVTDARLAEVCEEYVANGEMCGTCDSGREPGHE